MNAARGFWVRLKNRLDHGLATQEILDRLARVGIVIYPYFLVYSPVVVPSKVDPMNKDVRMKLLRADEAPLIATVAERPRPQAKMEEQLARSHCAAVMEGDELLGYCWYTRERLPGPISANALCELPPDWAYLFDMYVRPRARGRRLAAHIRGQIHQTLSLEGVTHCVGATLAFNRSSRRHQARMGSLEPELRLLLRVGPFAGLDMRLRRTAWPLRTPSLHVSQPAPRS